MLSAWWHDKDLKNGKEYNLASIRSQTLLSLYERCERRV